MQKTRSRKQQRWTGGGGGGVGVVGGGAEEARNGADGCLQQQSNELRPLATSAHLPPALTPPALPPCTSAT
eukprot:747584-Hanusia_phi.AAC.1